ncbi:hypothetical protein CCR75_002858 [Bremia lactucae]|uniref:MYND-type domain-containing protein n=1 Tax=Bremia lactucae TaxID=4779 RepID=A0A976IF55_BRELC|nr:hypothetical protein CCR75_002858 [Bremia lactucae]
MAEELLKCARFGDIDELKALLESVTSSNLDALVNYVQPETLNTPLHMACANGHITCVHELLHHGAKHVPNANGNLPLHWAVQNKHREIVKVLVDTVTDLDVLARNKFGRGCVTEAFQCEDTEILCELGSGCGVSGLAIYLYTNASRVVLSDLFATTVANLKYNVALNSPRLQTTQATTTTQEIQLDCCGRCGAIQRFTVENPDGKLLMCGGCKAIVYCSRACQKKAWKQHKSECQTIQSQRQANETCQRGSVHVQAIDWAHRETWSIKCEHDRYDVLIGSDLVYHQAMVPILVHVVDGMLAKTGQFLHIASQARHSLLEFEKAMTARGFLCHVDQVPEKYKTNPLRGTDAAAELFALHFNEMSDQYCIYTFTRTMEV